VIQRQYTFTICIVFTAGPDSVISRHLYIIYKEGELERAAAVAKYATAQTGGERNERGI